MRDTYNIYCDESCHLENDGINVMVLGAIWCPKSKLKEINDKIRKIKKDNGINPESEIKWTKVAPIKAQLYSEIIDYFFKEDDLHFRCVIVPDKSLLNHQRFNQTHDDWYYKMFYTMLKIIFNPLDEYEVYIDIKDTNSDRKSKKLHEVCCNAISGSSNKCIKKVQPIRSHEVQIIQITDILIGAVCYANRKFPNGFIQSETKQNLIQRIKNASGYTLNESTRYKEDKFNILLWKTEIY